jgi:ssDNA-binding Zn-finger/Zn-ribbon topoisomerase 1
MAIKKNKQNGQEFWGCTGYPECKNALPMPKEEAKVPVVRPGEPLKPFTKATTTMYVSYAKDIFCACYASPKIKAEAHDVMNMAIGMVKQAKEAFE